MMNHNQKLIVSDDEDRRPTIDLQINVCIGVDGNNPEEVYSYINKNSFDFGPYAKPSFKKIMKNIALNFDNTKDRMTARLGVKLFNPSKNWDSEVINMNLNKWDSDVCINGISDRHDEVITEKEHV